MDLRIQHHTSLDDAVLETLEALDQAIFPEPLSKQAFQRELQERRHLNIKTGFNITGVNQKSGEKYQTIILEKVLTPTPSPPAG